MAGSAPTGLQQHRWYALAVMSIGAFMTPFDASIVAVALATIGADLGLSYSEGLWAQAGYLLVASILLIPAGRLADARGPVKYYLGGTALFGLGSVIAALAPNGTVLILGRCIQGAGGAFMFSTASGVITAAFPSSERGRALGLNVTAVYVGLTLGPVVGGLIVSNASWRWIFLINVPIALATIAAGWKLLGLERRDRRAESGAGWVPPAAQRAPAAASSSRPRQRVDWAGALLLGGALICLFIPLIFSPLWGWGSGATIPLLLVAGTLFAGFVVVEDRVPDPMLDLDLLRRNRVFATANAAALLNYMAVFGVTTLTAVYLEIVLGLSPQQTGLLLLVQPVLMAVMSPFTGRLSDRVGTRSLATLGMALVAAGMVQIALAATSVERVFIALGTIGVGMAVFSAPNISAVMGSVERSRLSLASGFLSTMRFTGQGLSIAVLGAIAAWKLGPAGGRIILLGQTSSGTSTEAFADGYRLAMLVGAGLAAVGAVVSWAGRPVGRAEAASPRVAAAAGPGPAAAAPGRSPAGPPPSPPAKSRSWLPVAALILLALIWGYTWPVMKIMLDYAEPFPYAALRTFLAGLGLVLALPLLGRSIRPKALGLTALLGLLQTAGFLGLMTWALQGEGAGKTAILTYTMPFWLLLMAWVFLGERLKGFQWVAVVLALAGLILVIAPWEMEGGMSPLLAVGGALCWAASAIVAKLLRRRHEVDLLSLTAWQLLLGSLPLVVAAAFTWSPPVWSGTFIAGLVFTVVAGNMLAWILWLYILHSLPAGTAGLGMLLTPVIGITAAWIQLGEQPGAVEGLGMLLIVGALLLTVLSGILTGRRRRSPPRR
jgi:drug/metabolite transporter (DMT)-like permease/predicted MFS family arabinose efflux permease